MEVWDPKDEKTVFSQIKNVIAGSERVLTMLVVRLYPGNLVFQSQRLLLFNLRDIWR